MFPDPIPGIIPFGHVTLFAGEARVGKSPMLISWIPRWLSGKTIMGHVTNAPTAFCYLVGDRSWSAYQPWFDRVGCPPVPHYAIDDDPHFNLSLLNNEKLSHQILLDCLKQVELPPGATLILEPYAPGFMNGNQNYSRDVAAGMHRMRRLCRERQINIIAMVHFHKQSNDESKQYKRFIDRISGSGAFAGYSDTQMYLVGPNPPEQPYHVFGWNPPHAPEAQFHYVRGADGLFTPYLGLLDEGEDATRDRPTHVLALFPPQPESIDFGDLFEIAKQALNISRATLYRDLSVLQQRGLIDKDSWGAYMRRKLT